MAIVIGDLLDLRKRLSSGLRGYPAGCCLYTSARVEWESGLVRVDGHYIDDDGFAYQHSWNLDPETGKYVDLTANQFDHTLPEIVILDRNSEEAQRRYLEF